MECQGIVLVVDDDELSRNLCETILKDNGFSIRLAQNGRQAVEQYRQHNPDVVLMDVEMPEMNGIEALKVIKSLNPNACVIMMSGNPYLREYCSIADAFFTKPFSFRDILAKIGEILQADENADTKRDS